MMSLNYRAGSVIDSNAAQDNLLSNFAPDEQTVRRPPRSLHSTLSTPQYRVLRLRSSTLTAGAQSTQRCHAAKESGQVMANVCRAFLAIGVLFAEPQVLPTSTPACTPCAHHLWYN
jgi:hypothetical protein